MRVAPATVDSHLVAALRGEIPSDRLSDQFVTRARFHGIEPLLYRAGQQQRDPRLASLVRASALAFAAWEMQHRDLVVRAAAALTAADASPIVFKGTALAYSVYADPFERMRTDTDLLVPEDSRARATEALQRIGMALDIAAPSNASTFFWTARDGTRHTLDVHWRIANSQLLSRTFTYAELAARSQPLARLGAAVRAPAPVDALLIACLHRAKHGYSPYRVDGELHRDSDRLIWLYDVHLLAAGFQREDWDELVSRAAEKGLRSVCHAALRRSQALLGTGVPGEVLDALAAGPRELVAEYLASGSMRRRWLDFRAFDNWPARVAWARDWAFPPATYMRARYPRRAAQPLALLYALRLLRALGPG